MKKDRLALMGILMVLAALVWVALETIPFVVYRYEHPKLTETELQIIFLSRLGWWDLAPVALSVGGFYFWMKGDK